MTVEIRFVGGARTVTGSRHLVRTRHATILLDCGMFQGRRAESRQRNESLGFSADEVDAVVLSHAHIDHSGALPRLCKAGYEGPIYATPATRDLCAVMLEDAAAIQAADARYLNRRNERLGADERITPLYDDEDVARVLEQTISLPYHRRLDIAPGVRLSFLDAGHVLGSAITVLDLDDDGEAKRLVFTGDLGRRSMPLLRDPEIAEGATTLLLESTYGDRVHPPMSAMEEELAEVLQRTYRRGGRVIIPSFALERAQEVLYALHRLERSGRMPPMPIYVDSPLTIGITQIFRLHPECFDVATRKILSEGVSPFEPSRLRLVSAVEESKALDTRDEPSVIISASGMCEGGRVVHHLRAAIGDPRNTVMIVGFQAQHTLGRRIVEKRPFLRIFGVDHRLDAEVVVLNGMSAHADRNDLVTYAEAVRDRGALRRIALVHGELPAQESLRRLLESRGFPLVHVPKVGDTIEV